MKNHLLAALLAGCVLANPMAAGAATPGATSTADEIAANRMDDMTAAGDAPVDYGLGPGAGRAAPALAPNSSTRGPSPNGRVGAGFFDPPVTWPIIGLHEILLPDGRVLNYGTSTTGAQGAAMIYDVWDPSLGVGADAHTVLPNTTATDIFCSFQSMMWRTGEVLITGGDLTMDGKRNYSNNKTTIFSPPTNALIAAGAMEYPRWYPSIVAMPNGDMVTLGGRLAPFIPATTPEVFNPATGWRSLTGAANTTAFGNPASNWFYPKGFLAPDGNVFIVDNAGALWALDPSGAGTIVPYKRATTAGSRYLPTVMYAPGKLLSLRENATTVTISINGAQPVIKPSGGLDQVRFWANATVMADGKVLVTGGSATVNELVDADYIAQIWDPATGAWTPGAVAAKPRLYHSIALLLPDGTVLTGGGGAPGPVKELNSEIYHPPYLLSRDGSGRPAPRPTLAAAPSAVTVGQTVTATVGVADVINRVTFVRAGSVTHSTNIDQRFFDLPFSQAGAALSVPLPADANVMAPGYYMMFVFQNGVPSVAKIILATPGGTMDSRGTRAPSRRALSPPPSPVGRRVH